MSNAAPPTAPARIYKALLRLYPARFRDEFASEMLCDFEEATGDAWNERRWRGLFALWLLLSADFVRTVAVQWVRNSWPALIGVSAVSTLSCCVLIAQQFVPRPEFRLPQTDRSTEEVVLLMFSGVVLCLLIATTIIVTAWFWMFVVRGRRGA